MFVLVRNAWGVFKLFWEKRCVNRLGFAEDFEQQKAASGHGVCEMGLGQGSWEWGSSTAGRGVPAVAAAPVPGEGEREVRVGRRHRADGSFSVLPQAAAAAAEVCTSGTSAATAEVFTSGTVFSFSTGTFASQIAFGFFGAFT